MDGFPVAGQACLTLQPQRSLVARLWNGLCFRWAFHIFTAANEALDVLRAFLFSMMSHLVWQGFAVGVLAAFPLGPMGMVCVQRTLQQGRIAGLTSACGLTVAAALWCVVAAQGLSAMAEVVAGNQTLFTIGLGLFLVAAGVAGLARGRRQVEPVSSRAYGSLVAQFVSSLLGVLFNPITFVTMTAVLAILGGVEAKPGSQGLASLGAAVFVGGMTVWFCITQSIALMRDRLGQSGGARLSKALNYCILLLGVIYVIRPFLHDATG